MSIFDSFWKRSTLDAAIKQVAKARKSQGGMAAQLYQGAYQGFAKVVAGHPLVAESLYHWGFALLHEAGNQAPAQAVATLQDAISKFTFCLLTAPGYLGAAIDGGVACMALARINGEQDGKQALYAKAQQLFETAEDIQKGSAAYNLACIHALNGDAEACLAALQLANERGSLPEAEVILQDTDIAAMTALPWFEEFMATARFQTEPRKREKETPLDYEPGIKLKKTEDFDYYS